MIALSGGAFFIEFLHLFLSLTILSISEGRKPHFSLVQSYLAGGLTSISCSEVYTFIFDFYFSFYFFLSPFLGR